MPFSLKHLFGMSKQDKPHKAASNGTVVSDSSGEVQTAMLLRGLTDPIEYQWRLSLKPGDLIDVQDRDEQWRVAHISKATNNNLSVVFEDTKKAFDLMIHRGGARLARPFTKSQVMTLEQSLPPNTETQLQQVQVPHNLTIHPTLLATSLSTSPLTPWQPSSVDYRLTKENILYQSEPPMIDAGSGAMTVIPMAKDNSCFFHSIAFVCDGRKTRKGLHVMQQRLRAHQLVLADTQTFNEVVLGCNPIQYCQKLLDLNTWGSAIELGLFSSLYECEIFAFDYSQPTVYRFGDEHGYSKRVFIVYSGSHYDALAFIDTQSQAIQEFFSTRDNTALEFAQSVVETLYNSKTHHSKNSAVEWKGPGLYELRRKIKNYISPKTQSRALQQSQSAPPPNINISAKPRINSVSMATPKSTHAHRSSFSFSQSSINLLAHSGNSMLPHSAPDQRQIDSEKLLNAMAEKHSTMRASSPPLPPRPLHRGTLSTIQSVQSSATSSPSLAYRSTLLAVPTSDANSVNGSPSMGSRSLQQSAPPSLPAVLEQCTQ